MRINFIPLLILVSEIEGTLELSELYSYVSIINPEDEPKPVIDDNPSTEDVKFMKMADKVSTNSPDKSTKVSTYSSNHNYYSYIVNLLGRGHNS